MESTASKSWPHERSQRALEDLCRALQGPPYRLALRMLGRQVRRRSAQRSRKSSEPRSWSRLGRQRFGSALSDHRRRHRPRSRARLAIASPDVGGTCSSVGIHFAEIALPLLQMYQRGIRFVTGRIDARRDLPTATGLFAAGKFELGAIGTTVVPWSAAAAWTEDATKLVVRRD